MLYVDDTTQLYYLNARYYNPADGNFISQDSYRGEKEDQGTWQLYAYCANNPINYIDPSGHKWVSKTARFTFSGFKHGLQFWPVTSNLQVYYTKKNKKKTISTIAVRVYGRQHAYEIGNGKCFLYNVRIYKKKSGKWKQWKKIGGNLKGIPDTIIDPAVTVLYINKQTKKKYSVGKSKIKIWANIGFNFPSGTTTTSGGVAGVTVKF